MTPRAGAQPRGGMGAGEVVRQPGCELCEQPGGTLVWQDGHWRIVRVADPAFPAFYRLVSQAHHREWTDVPPPERRRGVALLEAIEQVLRQELPQAKINLASFGNVVAHVHWHVVARFPWDSHFPQPVWGTRQREPDAARLRALVARCPAWDEAVRAAAARAAGPAA
ncbi:MAG TPA: HIT domain-containing protein [Burkholderiaceae bacterium]|nr:HIT domain-containing protein [Burkholderiaceae bacterium]